MSFLLAIAHFNPYRMKIEMTAMAVDYQGSYLAYPIVGFCFDPAESQKVVCVERTFAFLPFLLAEVAAIPRLHPRHLPRPVSTLERLQFLGAERA